MHSNDRKWQHALVASSTTSSVLSAALSTTASAAASANVNTRDHCRAYRGAHLVNENICKAVSKLIWVQMIEVAVLCVAASHAKFVTQCAAALVVHELAEYSLPWEIFMLQAHRFPQVLNVHSTEAVEVRPENFINDGVQNNMHPSVVEFGGARRSILPPTPVDAEASCD